ncbi:hypothetical protein HPB52_007379 [Rhipicephalus sanguineus]|uniref:cGMP-dependent protein kinase interacting domain-containing protein n=1 Tax=Rhipicephalus sanguineus TaxID=34632 RepID=A0A9D4SPW7_RHISA|nr:hypothetical protein HPB52_007379 [Rhipicephalus sanguineus]
MSYGFFGGGGGGSRYSGYSSGLGTPYSSLAAPTALSRSLSPSPASYSVDRPRSPLRGSAGLSAYTAAGARMSPSRSPTLSRSYTGATRAAGGLATLYSTPDTVRGRSGSAGSLADSTKSETESRLSSSAASLQDDDELDYKKLYTELKEDYNKLKGKLSRTEDELETTRRQLEKAQLNNRNSLSDAEKRERRALERKISEMEEELKMPDVSQASTNHQTLPFQQPAMPSMVTLTTVDISLQVLAQLKAENAKLKAENRALTRVVSNLSK